MQHELAQLKEVPKGFESTGETRRKVNAPAYFTSPVSSRASGKKEVVIVKGKGEKLSAIPYVADQISSRKSTDKALSTLHHLAFGVPPKHISVKKNLREFSGVVYDAENNRARLESRIESRAVPLLRDLCTLLGVHAGSRADMVKNVADFLEKPAATDAKPKKKAAAKAKAPAAKKGEKKAEKKSASKKTTKKGEKKAAASKKKGEKKTAAKKGEKKAKKEGPKRPASAYLLFCKAKRAEVVAANKNDKATDIVKKLGEMWKAADAATKKPFETAAAEDKKRYDAECKKSKN